ncbi:MAG: DUF2634 domain-containing protein [Lachnospiraceae bacterium]|nr:DUF2634 domain-containing protein [Lachnospiraceae bacterium]
MSDLFPSIQPQASESASMGLYKEVKWDFTNDCPILRRGEPVIVSGAEAVKTWAWNALKTARKRYAIFTWDYGSDFEQLIGQGYSEDTKQMECKRYLRDCLMVNPYISDVTDIEISFEGTALSVSCNIESVYGDFEIGSDGIV